MREKIKHPRVVQTRAHLETADGGLAEAHRSLVDAPPHYVAAVASLVEIIEAGLRAFLDWNGGDWLDGAPLARRAERAESRASILRTPLRPDPTLPPDATVPAAAGRGMAHAA